MKLLASITTTSVIFLMLQLNMVAHADDLGPLKSTRAHGVIVLAPEKSLINGRLMMRVVAYNGGTDPVQLTPASIHVATAAGTAVPLLSVDQLVKEVQESQKTKAARPVAGTDIMPRKFSQDTGSAMRDSAGNVVHGVNGGVNTSLAHEVPYSPPADETATTNAPKQAAAVTQQQIADLRAGILQTLTVQPRAAAGAQIVTDKLKFEPSENRALHVTVDFNGEQHELTVPVPADS